MHSSVLICGYFPPLSRATAFVHVRTFSYVCVASSREGQRMTPTGPSPRTKGSFVSSSRANMIRGRQKAKVFPDPVKAIPIMSRPAKLARASQLKQG